MKKALNKLLLSICILSWISCQNQSGKTNNTTIAEKLAVKTIELPAHTDDGKPYFSILVLQNDSVIKNIVSDKPLFIATEKVMTIMLDSSHHLLKNGDMLDLYLNGKGEKIFPVVTSNAGKDSATAIFSFTQANDYITPIFPNAGKIIITKFSDSSCSGSFELTQNDASGKGYLLKGEFQHVKTE